MCPRSRGCKLAIELGRVGPPRAYEQVGRLWYAVQLLQRQGCSYFRTDPVISSEQRPRFQDLQCPGQLSGAPRIHPQPLLQRSRTRQRRAFLHRRQAPQGICHRLWPSVHWPIAAMIQRMQPQGHSTNQHWRDRSSPTVNRCDPLSHRPFSTPWLEPDTPASCRCSGRPASHLCEIASCLRA